MATSYNDSQKYNKIFSNYEGISINYIEISEDIKTSSGVFGIAQAFALLHVMRRQGGNIFISFERNVSTLNT